MNGPTYDTGAISGPLFVLYRCLLDFGYKVKSCKKSVNYYRILLTPEDPNCFHKDRLVRLYAHGSFKRVKTTREL